ncbi:beta-galactosidase trimerization domain-containing protein [Novipirellula sp. SH528]|uniref:beta-galactosidase trimerization domain-containing protein n=1 Tax=Novipirellula sp. SH528 TaxID=3454466 RepID=UPI003FA08387
MKYFLFAILSCLLLSTAQAEPIFVEAESFVSATDGWQVAKNQQTRAASRLHSFHGATGDPLGTARKPIEIEQPGNYRVWVRYLHHERFRGPFQLAVVHGDKSTAKDVDLEPKPDAKSWAYVWDYVDVKLPAGTVELELTKFEQKNCSSYVRHVDCFLLTTDKTLVPDHLPHGEQTFLRVTLGEVYDEPAYVHIFADHYRAPWYQHFHLSKAGAQQGLQPKNGDQMLGGEQTPWCNITPMLYQDSGAILNISVRHTYHQRAAQLQARFEFATAADEQSIVRTMDVESVPNGLVVVVPPDLTTAEHLSRLKRDADFAEATGRIADAFDWPEFGSKPQRIPFFVSATVGGYGTQVDQSVSDREWKTLDYFGFSNRSRSHIGGVWHMLNRSYCRPDIERMKEHAAAQAAAYRDSGKSIDDIVYCMLMDEPAGQSAAFMAQDEAYGTAFREWLKKRGKSPADLLVSSWDEVKPVPEDQRDEFPALHYFTQRFRTRALGVFMATQRGILEQAYGRSLPTLVNFSDGATYHANMYGQGVDYFELLDDDDQNAIWSEDWANGASSYQCGAYNVDLMRAAARERGQLLGHYLVAHAGRKSWDIKLKAASETARGVRIWKNFSYGVSWGNHEGGPAWKSHTWYSKPETWRANAEVVREIGGAEDLLRSATAAPAEVAILYSSSSDAWTSNRNHAFGFHRMHTWMALAHAQVPVDFVGERQVERGGLEDYKVCYVDGPNLTREAAQRLSEWVAAGGVVYLSAGAASRDEYNRPLEVFDSQLPAERDTLETLQPFLNSGSYVHVLQPRDRVVADGVTLDVLSVRQHQTPREGSDVLAKFKDGSAAIVRSNVGTGMIYSVGFLPALDYIRQAVVARREMQISRTNDEDAAANRTAEPTPTLSIDVPKQSTIANSTADTRLDRSYNPWQFPAEVRELILQPVRAAGVDPALTCNIPLVDAVLLHAESGAVIPVANYTLKPIDNVEFRLRSPRPIARIESIHHGVIAFESGEKGIVRFSLPLDASDYIKVYY